jgi:acyl-coenzyme A thioesterase PaaI-like protein
MASGRVSSAVSLDELRVFFARDFPQCTVTIEAVGHGTARVRQAIGHDQLRPGGTVSGPVMMATADAASYAAILGAIGIVPLAVTTSSTSTSSAGRRRMRRSSRTRG